MIFAAPGGKGKPVRRLMYIAQSEPKATLGGRLVQAIGALMHAHAPTALRKGTGRCKAGKPGAADLGMSLAHCYEVIILAMNRAMSAYVEIFPGPSTPLRCLRERPRKYRAGLAYRYLS